MKNTLCVTIFLLHLCAAEIQNPTHRNRGLTEALLKFIVEGTNHFEEEPQDVTDTLPEYDFIVVGAGSAGCVISNRLTEISDWNVLLIEAGGRENYVMDIPLLATTMQFSEANWKYRTVPSDNVCLSMENRQCSYPRGKVMGGSSTINFMIYTRGNKRSYDYWEEMGNPGWGYKDVLPYFLKLENMTIPELAKNKEYHSTSGEITVSYAPYRTQLADAFIQGGTEMGYKIVDYNGETQIGFSYIQSTIRNGTRWSASRAFLHPVRERKNLHIKKRSLVTKILIDPESKNAYGVEFVRDNKKYVVRARKEVIVSAGAINSPQLLMLSGIGPRTHLTDMKIPVIQDLKVGYNLMDHPGMISATFLVNKSVGIVADRLLEDGGNLRDFLSYHQGPFSIPAGCEGIAFLDTKNSTSDKGNPDIELLFFAGGIPSELTYYKSLGLSDEFYNAIYKPVEGAYSWSVVPLVLQPKSRGRVMLKSANPRHKPLIYHDFYEDPEDLETELLAIRKMLDLSNASAFQKLGSKIHDIPVPGCEHLQFSSDDYWRCAARHTSTGIWHLSGTCKMGPYWDPDAVVDPRLRVYGIKGLRVIDASIMPIVPTAHTNIPSMMIGEKGADLLKMDWGDSNALLVKA